jgi:hypothetical protein
MILDLFTIGGTELKCSGTPKLSGGGPLSDEDAEMVAEHIKRLGVSPILTPDGRSRSTTTRACARTLRR